MRESAHKIEVCCRDGRAFDLSYFPSREEAESAAKDSLAGDVREARLLDESGKVLRTFDKDSG